MKGWTSMSDMRLIKENRKRGNVVYEMIYSKPMEVIALVLYKIGLGPNTITFMSFLLVLIAATMLIFVQYFNTVHKILYFCFIQLGFILDGTDGIIARINKKQSNFGALFDSTTDRLGEALMFFSIGFHYFRKTGLVITLYLMIFALIFYLINSYVHLLGKLLGDSNNNQRINNKQGRIISFISKHKLHKLIKGFVTTTILLSIVPIIGNYILVNAMFIYYGLSSFIILLLKIGYFYKKGIIEI